MLFVISINIGIVVYYFFCMYMLEKLDYLGILELCRECLCICCLR